MAVAAGGSEGDGNDNGDDGDATALYQVFFEPSPPGIDVSSCVGHPVGWCCQPVSVHEDRTFNDTWAVLEPNVMRVTGHTTATTFEATLACVSGGTTGSITASGTEALYTGTFQFRGSAGNVRIVRQ